MYKTNLPDGEITVEPLPHAQIFVDLTAIRDNYRTLQNMANGAECAPVLKANAYGLGLEPISRALFMAGARTFFVAYLKEAIQLRELFCRTTDVQIYVLEGNPPDSETLFVENNLSPVINCFDQYFRWRNCSLFNAETQPCAIHIDTGMNRLGFGRKEYETLKKCISKDKINIDLYITHLASADESESQQSCSQLNLFQEITDDLPKARRSIANSAGVFLSSEYRYDMIRTGISLYGSNIHTSSPILLKPVVQIRARILQIREIDEGEPIGYGATYISERPMRLGTVSIGYADGFPRSASGSEAGVFYRNQKARLVGRVSMDTIVVDFSEFDKLIPKVNEFVEVFTDDQGIDELARYAGTISNDILISFGNRFEWSYITLNKIQDNH